MRTMSTKFALFCEMVRSSYKPATVKWCRNLACGSHGYKCFWFTRDGRCGKHWKCLWTIYIKISSWVMWVLKTYRDLATCWETLLPGWSACDKRLRKCGFSFCASPHERGNFRATSGSQIWSAGMKLLFQGDWKCCNFFGFSLAENSDVRGCKAHWRRNSQNSWRLNNDVDIPRRRKRLNPCSWHNRYFGLLYMLPIFEMGQPTNRKKLGTVEKLPFSEILKRSCVNLPIEVTLAEVGC